MRRLAMVLLLSCITCLAQKSAKYQACSEKAKTQAEMNACASDELAREDAELNAVYQKLLAQAASDPNAVAKIKTSERAWVAYRDAYLDAMYPAEDKTAQYGTIYALESSLARTKLTRHQTAALKELLLKYGGKD
jgi:uncharacterized protein YecT (DUF1311 family)